MTDSPEFRRQQAEMQELRGFLENTMTEKKQPDRLDVEMKRFAELRRQAALIEELREALKSVLDSLGAMSRHNELMAYMSEDDAYAVFLALAKAEVQS